MVEPKMTPQEAFRSSLQDVVAVVKKLSPVCKTPEELAGVLELALENDAQLRILMIEVGKKS